MYYLNITIYCLSFVSKVPEIWSWIIMCQLELELHRLEGCGSLDVPDFCFKNQSLELTLSESGFWNPEYVLRDTFSLVFKAWSLTNSGKALGIGPRAPWESLISPGTSLGQIFPDNCCGFSTVGPRHLPPQTPGKVTCIQAAITDWASKLLSGHFVVYFKGLQKWG